MRNLFVICIILGTVFFNACKNEADVGFINLSDPSQISFENLVANGDEFVDCDVEAIKVDLEESAIADVLPEQITACRAIGDIMFGFVSQPNAYTGLTTVREWEKEGNTAWSGLLYKHVKGPLVKFFEIPQNGQYGALNPLALYLEDEQLVLDVVDDSGAGSGEGHLARFVYPFAGVVDELLYKWAQEACNAYYVPEVYTKTYKNCEELS